MNLRWKPRYPLLATHSFVRMMARLRYRVVNVKLSSRLGIWNPRRSCPTQPRAVWNLSQSKRSHLPGQVYIIKVVNHAPELLHCPKLQRESYLRARSHLKFEARVLSTFPIQRKLTLQMSCWGSPCLLKKMCVCDPVQFVTDFIDTYSSSHHIVSSNG